MNLIFRMPVTRFHGTSGLKCASIRDMISLSDPRGTREALLAPDLFSNFFLSYFNAPRVQMELPWYRSERTGRSLGARGAADKRLPRAQITHNYIMQSGWAISNGGRSSTGNKQRFQVRRGKEKNNAKYPELRTPTPCQPPGVPPFFIEDPLYVDHSIDRSGSPWLQGDLAGSIVRGSRKGCLKYVRLIFFFNATTSRPFAPLPPSCPAPRT